ncbi:MAG: threonine synthase [Woeseiaceae bacterium]|jgi:threonine synthase
MGEPFKCIRRLRGNLVVNFISTRGDQSYGIDDVLAKGIADDGGLFIPEELPYINHEALPAKMSLTDTAEALLAPYFKESILQNNLNQIIKESLYFSIPSVKILPEKNVWFLELFHGPTAAFKDVGAGFLASCMSRLNSSETKPLVVLVATSGDTGGAVAAAFHGLPNVKVIILFPKDKVSKRQEKQLTCWGGNILSLTVNGTFDDCQTLVKDIFIDPKLSARYRFSSANSINFGRLLPQSIYYAHSSLNHFRQSGNKANFIIPTGNLGNGLACLLAREMGFPVGEIVLSVNANRLIADYLNGAEWLPKSSIQTLANAMDVGNPSNMERLSSLFGQANDLKSSISAVSVSDENISSEITRIFEKTNTIICPHTATASYTYSQFTDEVKMTQDWFIAATAHPAKFETIVEPLIGQKVAVPDDLSVLLDKPSKTFTINPDIKEFEQIIIDKSI